MQLTEDQIKRLARRHVSSKGIGETIVVGGSSNDRSSGYADIAKRAYEADHAKSAATLDDGSTTLQKIDEKYLSKEHDDAAEGIIDFLKGIKIGGRPLSELFLSKEHDDTAEGNIGFGKNVKINGQLTGDNIRSSAFNSGMQDGVGFRMMYDGKESWLEIDKLTVRMRAIFQALDVRKAEFSAGNPNASKPSG